MGKCNLLMNGKNNVLSCDVIFFPLELGSPPKFDATTA